MHDDGLWKLDEMLEMTMEEGWCPAYELHGDDYTPHVDGRGRIIWLGLGLPEVEERLRLADHDAHVRDSDACHLFD